MEGAVIVFNRNTPYMTRKQLAQEFGVSTRMTYKYTDGLKNGIEYGIYSPYVLCDNRINFYAVIHFLKWRDYFNDKNLRKNIPPFNPVEIAELCGFCMKTIRVDA